MVQKVVWYVVILLEQTNIHFIIYLNKQIYILLSILMQKRCKIDISSDRRECK